MNDEAEIRARITEFFGDLQLSRTSGSDGHNCGLSTKAELLLARRADVEDACVARIRRLALLGDAVSLFFGT